MGRARGLLERGESERALDIVEQWIDGSPDDQNARALATACRETIERQCIETIGSLSATLVVAIPPTNLRQSSIDSIAGYVLSLIDGATTVETLLDLCGPRRLNALQRLRDLVAKGVVQVVDKGS